VYIIIHLQWPCTISDTLTNNIYYNYEICGLPLCIECWPWLSGKTWNVSEESNMRQTWGQFELDGKMLLWSQGTSNTEWLHKTGKFLDTQVRTNALFIPHSNLHLVVVILWLLDGSGAPTGEAKTSPDREEEDCLLRESWSPPGQLWEANEKGFTAPVASASQ